MKFDHMSGPMNVSGVFRDVTSKPYHDDKAATRKLNRMIAAEDHLLVFLPISHLHATQPCVNGDFRDAAKRPHEDGFDLPAVVKYRGNYYVADGHHRLMATADEGNVAAQVRLFDLDGDTQIDFPLLDLMEAPCPAPDTDLDPQA